MQPVIISDTSCLILLQKIGELLLLQKLFDHIIVTQMIADEWNDPLPQWIHIQNPISIINQFVLEATLDKGEASTIALALETKDCVLIIDEQKGRKMAKQLGIAITGTLGILAQAKQNGFIVKLKPLLDTIQRTDFRLSEYLIQEVLKQVGE